jgi:hypothetical protein
MPRSAPDKAHERCATMPVHDHFIATRPDYAIMRAAIENSTLARRAAKAAPRVEPVTIPVVVHVVYRTAEENISEEQIHSQLDVLNHDYRKTNPDVTKVPEIWQPLVGDALLEFKLAESDPEGAPTTGIVRQKTTREAFGSDDAVKHTELGGSDAWPADRYLNLWVCQATEYLGYAQFPGGAAETDGVVVRHNSFGTTGTAEAPYDGGRTATHEIGHWLNLRHIWGDDGNACTGSDFVEDTPNQAGSNKGAPAYPKVSCNNGPHGDMFMNYMDYVEDRAMYMFTKGQVERMDACLAGPRSSFLTETVRESMRVAVPGPRI